MQILIQQVWGQACDSAFQLLGAPHAAGLGPRLRDKRVPCE